MTTKVSDDARQARIQQTISALQGLVEIFEDRREALARSVGLSPTQWQVLEQVGQDDFMPSLFARRRDVSAAAVSRTLRQLLDLRLVDVQISPRDARQRLYRVTEKGRKALDEVRAERERAIGAVWEGLSDADLTRFGNLARELTGRLRAYEATRV
jgi:DNA-binding MarR family transcriptional regulator